MLTGTGEQILEMLVIGGIIFIAAAILIIAILLFRKKQSQQGTVEVDILESNGMDGEEFIVETHHGDSKSTSDFVISKETKISGEDEEDLK